MKMPAPLLTVTVLLVSLAAFAHGGLEHLKGTVTQVGDATITLAVDKGGPVTVHFDATTEFKRGSAAVTTQEVRTGEKVVVHAAKHDGHLLAKLVKLAPLPASEADGGTAVEPSKTERPHDHAH